LDSNQLFDSHVSVSRQDIVKLVFRISQILPILDIYGQFAKEEKTLADLRSVEFYQEMFSLEYFIRMAMSDVGHYQKISAIRIVSGIRNDIILEDSDEIKTAFQTPGALENKLSFDSSIVIDYSLNDMICSLYIHQIGANLNATLSFDGNFIEFSLKVSGSILHLWVLGWEKLKITIDENFQNFMVEWGWESGLFINFTSSTEENDSAMLYGNLEIFQFNTESRDIIRQIQLNGDLAAILFQFMVLNNILFFGGNLRYSHDIMALFFYSKKTTLELDDDGVFDIRGSDFGIDTQSDLEIILEDIYMNSEKDPVKFKLTRMDFQTEDLNNGFKKMLIFSKSLLECQTPNLSRLDIHFKKFTGFKDYLLQKITEVESILMSGEDPIDKMKIVVSDMDDLYEICQFPVYYTKDFDYKYRKLPQKLIEFGAEMNLRRKNNNFYDWLLAKIDFKEQINLIRQRIQDTISLFPG
jgi:hypothetical protein